MTSVTIVCVMGKVNEIAMADVTFACECMCACVREGDR